MILEDLIKDFAAAIGAETPQEEMAIVKGFMTLSSAVIPTVQFKDRDHRNTRANLYYAVVGNAGSNKSRIGKLEKLVLPVHNQVRSYEDALRAKLDKNDKKPPRKNVLLSGNITRARVIEHLCANEDTPLIIVDSEMDSITTSMQVDHGGFRAELRKAYHGEFIGSSKKTDDELLESDFPHMSIMVTGTYDQAVKYLAPIGDGFASRHLYDVNLKPSTFTPYGKPGSRSPESTLNLWAKHYHKLWEFFSSRNVEVKFSETQIQQINDLGYQWEKDIKTQNEDNSLDFLFRHLLMVFKAATVATAWSAYFENDASEELKCKDADFAFAMHVIQDSYRHLQDLYAVLPMKKELKVSLNETELHILHELDQEFTTDQAYELGRKNGLSERRVREYLKKYVVTGSVQRKSQGKYCKA
jgi:hypothetical protein